MLTLLLTWIGIAVGVTVLLLMALGPAIIELDGWLAERKRNRRAVKVVTAREKAAAKSRDTTPSIVPHAA
jgi:hypothetical protein